MGCLFLKMTIITQTPRLVIREITVDDAQLVFDLNSNPNVTRYTSDPAFKNLEDAIELIKNVIQKQYTDYGHGRWAVVLKSNNSFMGWCGLKYMPDIRQVDLGYRFMQEYWGNGYATEAAKESLRIGFNTFKYNEIIGRVMKPNVNSIKVLEKCGMYFSHEADLHEHPAFVYKITKEEFNKLVNVQQV